VAGRGGRDGDETRDRPRDDDRSVAYWERAPAEAVPPTDLARTDRPGEPPVVARLIVEIRSDGRHTIARGALEDAATGRGVAVEAAGRSPLQLALSLARALVTLPVFGRAAARALLRSPSRPGPNPGDDDPSSRGH
jgi:hypothetical protein